MSWNRFANQRHDLAYRSIRQEYLDEFGLSDKDECFQGPSARHWDKSWYITNALLYLDLIYNEITSPTGFKYTTLNEYNELYNWTTVRDGYACKGVYLDELVKYYSFEAIIANSHTDTQLMINSITVNDSYTSNFPTT